jgi:hypothetical protein
MTAPTQVAPGARCFLVGFGAATVERHHDLTWWDVKLDIPSLEYGPTLRVNEHWRGFFLLEERAAALWQFSLAEGHG